MNIPVIEFFIDNVKREEFENKRIIEVGSKYVNGSVRPLIEKFLGIKEYIGVDIEQGKYVDLICPAEKLVEYFGKASFDVVIATEFLEHVKDWRIVIQNMKDILKPGGYIYITTRSKGFPYHGHPYDFWRYEIEDMKNIFSDFEIIVLEKDRESQGVFLKAVKSKMSEPADLSNLSLYSIIMGQRINFIADYKSMPIFKKMRLFIPGIVTIFQKKIITLINKIITLINLK